MNSTSEMSPEHKDHHLYVDVTGLFYHEGVNLTGIYRVEFELGRHLSLQTHQFETSIIYWNGKDYAELDREDFLYRDFKKYRQKSDEPKSHSFATVFTRAKERLYRHLIAQDQKAMDELLAAYQNTFKVTFLALLRVCKGIASHLPFPASSQKAEAIPSPDTWTPNSVGMHLKQGSTLFVPTSAWVSNINYSHFLNRVVTERGLRFVPIVYDLIPLDYPRYVTNANAQAFKFGFSVAWRKAEKIITISEYSRGQIQSQLPEWKKNSIDIDVVRLGGNISHIHDDEDQDPPSSDWHKRLDGQEFIIFVSTLNPRKNHLFMVKVWEQLHFQYGDKLPVLVFVGQAGWSYEGIFSAIESLPSLEHKIVFTDRVSEKELHWLYQKTLFTVYPSIVEGWGLPITESLSFGKVCIASNTSAMSEAAGGLCPTCDPGNIDDWVQTIAELLDDRNKLSHYETEIENDFAEVSWEDTATDVLCSIAE